MRIEFLLAALFCSTTAAIGQTQPTSTENIACIIAVTREFTARINGIVATSKGNLGSGNYNMMQDPKAFALCIDWERSTRHQRYGNGFGFARGESSLDSRAIDWCEQSDGARSGICRCEIVHRNGFPAIKFPSGWLERQCR